MSLNDAIDIIERMQKLSKRSKKENVRAEIKACWGKLEDLARDEACAIDSDIENAFLRTALKRRVKHHNSDTKYHVLIIETLEKMSLEDAQEELQWKKELHSNCKIFKNFTVKIVREDMLKEVV